MPPGGGVDVKGRCCRSDLNEASGASIRTATRAKQSFAASVVPGGALLLLPKCPACIAGYIALGTGIGVSVATAAYLREGLVMLFVGIIGYFVVSGGRALTKHFCA
jgi:hypothetical protein